MALDDRDRNFEKALARHFRLSASSGVEPAAPGASSLDSCPDPETLAAYHDGSLSAEERNLWKQHVLGCENCQFVLAHLQTPLEIPVNVAASENVLASQRAASSPSAASPVRAARPSPIHKLRWLWLVPAGAIAATLIAWISLHEQKPTQLAKTAPVEVAENRQPAASAPSAAPAPGEREEKDQSADKSVGGSAGAVSSKPDATAPAKQLRNEVQLAQQAPRQYAANAPHGPSLSLQQQQRQQTSRITPDTDATALLDKKKENARADSGAAIGGRDATLPSPSPAPGFLADGAISNLKMPMPKAVTAPAPASPAKPAAPQPQAANTDAISAVTESVEVSSEAGSLNKMRAAILHEPHVFSSPDEKHLWRLGPAGSLEYSKDRGAKWTPQVSGVSADLTAASAPSGKVCWIVGSAGTILRSTDGGAHWIKLDAPAAGDLAGVSATDAKHAKIWFVPDQPTGLARTFQTSDGGATWSPSPNQN